MEKGTGVSKHGGTDKSPSAVIVYDTIQQRGRGILTYIPGKRVRMTDSEHEENVLDLVLMQTRHISNITPFSFSTLQGS